MAGVLTENARPIALEVIEATFTGRGPWKRRIPQILDALAALGRAARRERAVDAGLRALVVLHALQKKTQSTSKRDIEVAKSRFAQLTRGD